MPGLGVMKLKSYKKNFKKLLFKNFPTLEKKKVTLEKKKEKNRLIN